MCIYLRRGKVRMPQQFFHRLQIGIIIKHRCRKRVTQDMGRTFLLCSHIREASSHNPIYLVYRQAFSRFQIHKYGLRIQFTSRLFPQGIPILSQRSLQFIAKRHHPLFISFPRHLQQPAREINIRPIQPIKFRPSQACRIENQHYQTVSLPPQRLIKESPIQEFVHFLFTHECRKRLIFLGALQRTHGITTHQSPLQQEPIEGL